MDLFSPQAVTGLVPYTPPATSANAPAVASSAGPSSHSQVALWSPDNPLMWFGAIAAVTIGLMAVNASIRVGPFKASAGAGKKG